MTAETHGSTGAQQARDALSVAARQLAIAFAALDDARSGPLTEAVVAIDVATEAIHRAWDAVAWLNERIPE